MKNRALHPLALVGVVSALLLVIAVSAKSQTQQRVQTTTQLTVRTPVVAGSLSDWEKQYAQAMKLTAELGETGSSELAAQIESDLRAMDAALREYVRAAESLRHRDRALSATIDALDNSVQKQSQMIHTLSNLLKIEHDTKMAVVRKIS